MFVQPYTFAMKHNILFAKESCLIRVQGYFFCMCVMHSSPTSASELLARLILGALSTTARRLGHATAIRHTY